ncbi:MAG: hypothetical protein IT210_19890 [Armatimonadetes bacterium]|nr:hypothetical protein [Armatimonadota bacterium]
MAGKPPRRLFFADTPPRRKARPTRPLPPAVLFPCDSIHRAAVMALSTVGRWRPYYPFALGCSATFGSKRQGEVQVRVGLPEGFDEAERDLLAANPPRLVKAHYALWGRYFQDSPDPEAGGTLGVEISQFLEDTGIRKAARGGFKRERKEEALALLKALSAVRLYGSFAPAGSVSPISLRGPLWHFGSFSGRTDRAPSRPEYLDPGQWEPFSYIYAPGSWFYRDDWRARNRFTGKVSRGLLRLRADTEGWAILIGGYLATLARTNHYAPKSLKVATLLEKTGLAQSEDAAQRTGTFADKLERALNRLIDARVVTHWKWDHSEGGEEIDPSWREAIVKIGFRDETVG